MEIFLLQMKWFIDQIISSNQKYFIMQICYAWWAADDPVNITSQF